MMDLFVASLNPFVYLKDCVKKIAVTDSNIFTVETLKKSNSSIKNTIEINALHECALFLLAAGSSKWTEKQKVTLEHCADKVDENVNSTNVCTAAPKKKKVRRKQCRKFI